MKKILLLGGSAQQVIAIKKAKELGYYTIVCDYLDDNPGQNYADKFYLASTTDKEVILEIARIENIDGILAYASDPAAPTAAYVSEKLNLPGNPHKSVDLLCNKNKFRQFLKENGFNSPTAISFDNLENAISWKNKQEVEFPLIVKPVDSSGSKGVTKVYDPIDLMPALKFAFKFSKSKKIIVEKLIEKNHEYLVGGDILIYNREIILPGLLNCHRDTNVNELVPVGKSYPLQLDKEYVDKILQELKKLVNLLNIDNCALNVEAVVDSSDKVWFVDVGPRNGGNLIPELLSSIYNIDIVSLTINMAMGEKIRFSYKDPKDTFYASYNIHSDRDGILKDIIFSDKLEDTIFYKNIYKKRGDCVEYFDNASKALGVIFLKFNREYEGKTIINQMHNYIKIELE